MKRTFTISCTAVMTTLSAFSADWYGTHANEAGVFDWNDAANWNSATGVPEVNVDFTESVIAEKNGSKTVTFSAAQTISGNFHAYAGTEEAPLVFKASGANGLAMTAGKDAFVGNGTTPGYLVLDGGTYTFMNDLKPGYNGADATVVVKEGAFVHIPYWLRMTNGGNSGNGTSVLKVEGGEVVMGYREGAEKDNGVLTFADANDTKSVFTMTGGRVRSQGTGTDAAFQFGRGARSTATGTISGGTIDSVGAVKIPQANNATATIEMTGGTWNATGDFRVASDGSSNSGTFTNGGGAVVCGGNFAVGAQANDTGSYTQTAGSLKVNGMTYIGRHGGTGAFVLEGGTVEALNTTLVGSTTGTGTYTVRGGTATLSEPLVAGSDTTGIGTAVLEDGVINIYKSPLQFNCKADGSSFALNGGTLFCKRVENNNSGTATFTFNGGTLKPVQSVGNFIEKKGSMVIAVGAKGGTIDMNGLANTINTDFVSGVAEGETDGGMTFTGKGRVILNGSLGYTGATTIADGVVYVKPGATFNGGLTIGAQGTLAVDLTGAVSAETELGTKIALFTSPTLAFAAENDTLEAAVFLTGPAIGYTLSYEAGTVYATVTNLDKVAETRKVTVYLAEDNWIDQDGAWNNNKPNANAICVFNADAIMHIWGNNKGAINNIRFATMAIRGCRAKVMYGNDGFPPIETSRITGNGTLVLARAGVVGKDGYTTVVDPGVTIEITCEGVADNNDAWIGFNNAANTTEAIINGDVYTKDGFLSIYTGVTFNGDVTLNGYSRASYIGGTATEVTFNGALILGAGATFNCANKKLVLGEDFRLVLKGGTLTNVSAESAEALKAAEVIIEAGTYTRGALPGGVENVTVAGGKLLLTPPAEGDGQNFDLTGITLAEGVDPAEVLQMGNSEYSWTYEVNAETGVLVAVAGPVLDPTIPNHWIGGAKGLWRLSSNWTRGVPTIEQTVVFDDDAIVCNDEGKDIFGEAGKLVLNGHHVTVTSQDNNANYWGALRIASFDENETGTLTVWRQGIWNKKSQPLDFPATMKLEFDNPSGKDCWIHEDYSVVTVKCPVELLSAATVFNLDYTVHLLGGVTGPGTVTGRQKSGNSGQERRFLGGDWSGFTGRYNGHGQDRSVFTTTFTGGDKATWNFPQYFRFEQTEGRVTLGRVILTNDRHIEVLKDSTLVIEIGGNDSDSTLSQGTTFYTNSDDWKDGAWTQGSSTVTIRKVGTGTLTSQLVSAATLEVVEGMAAIAASNESLALAVKSGATVTANAEVTIGSATFETGAQVKLASADAAAVHPIAVKAAVDVTGVAVTMDAAVRDALVTQEEGDASAYTLLASETGLSGQPNGDVVVACEDEVHGWKAQAVGQTLQLRRKYVKPGLIIIVM